MKIVSWQSVLTEHQTHTLRALQESAGEPIVIVAGVRELDERKQQGWSVPDCEGLRVRLLPTSGWWQEAVSILDRYNDAVHLFNGLWADRRFFFLLLAAQQRGIRTGLVTEPYSETGVGYLQEESGIKPRLKQLLRPWAYRIAGRLVAGRLCPVFAISEAAVRQMTGIGVRKECVLPFGYFVPAMKTVVPKRTDYPRQLSLVFVGALISRKGIHVLAEAMRICHRRGYRVVLDIYGPGNANIFKGAPNVRYVGQIPFGETQKIIVNYDMLVLPSLHDGWGVVVNEALLQGVPVLVSDRVGAKALIESSGAGAIIPAGDAGELARCIGEVASGGRSLHAWKEAALAYRAILEPRMAGRYMYECMRYVFHERGEVPANRWYPA